MLSELPGQRVTVVRHFVAGVSAHQGTCDRRYLLAIAATDLVAEQAADHRTNTCANRMHVIHVIADRPRLRLISGLLVVAWCRLYIRILRVALRALLDVAVRGDRGGRGLGNDAGLLHGCDARRARDDFENSAIARGVALGARAFQTGDIRLHAGRPRCARIRLRGLRSRGWCNGAMGRRNDTSNCCNTQKADQNDRGGCARHERVDPVRYCSDLIFHGAFSCSKHRG